MRAPRTGSRSEDPPTAGDALRRAADALVRLVREHLALARVELRNDLRVAARDAAFALAAVPVLVVGWALLMVSLALVSGTLFGTAGGFAVVGALHLAVGGVVMWVFAKKLAGGDRPDLDVTTSVLQEDRRWLQRLTRARNSEPVATIGRPDSPPH